MKKSKPVSLILAFFFGWFGGHKFYLGQMTSGVLYLLFSWTLVPALLSLYFIVTHIFLTEEEFAKRYERSQAEPTKGKTPLAQEKPTDLKGVLTGLKATWNDPVSRKKILKKAFFKNILG